MNFKKLFFILIVLLFSFQVAAAAENEYGIVRAWFNGENATVNGIQLKIGEPVEVKVEVISRIDGNSYLELNEPGVTKGFEVLEGPSKLEEMISNPKITNGWSNTYFWVLKPNGNWKNGNAPINVFVSFSKKGNQKPIQFTIANPYILDEQYSGAVPTPETTASPAGTQAKETPFLSVIFMVGALLLVWLLGKEKS
ncbi:MAG TPA: sarcinarray family MAST domain-containing protein [Candidatus Methanoperedens sp.]|nr:sarcinarray family MAST domain-containing protein [Candidatus Methanoperedens sp.]